MQDLRISTQVRISTQRISTQVQLIREATHVVSKIQNYLKVLEAKIQIETEFQVTFSTVQIIKVDSRRLQDSELSQSPLQARFANVRKICFEPKSRFSELDTKSLEVLSSSQVQIIKGSCLLVS